MTEARPRVLVYRNELLRSSETFIREQALALERYEPCFVGVVLNSGLALPPEKVFLPAYSGLGGMFRKQMLWRFPAFPRPYIETLRALSPSLIHAHFAFDGYWARRIARALRIPLVVTLHGYDVTTGTGSQRRRRAEVFRTADHFVAISRFIRNTAVADGCPAERTTVLYTGIDMQAFSPAPAQSATDVVFVGRLEEKKGCEYLVRAMASVQQRRPDTSLVIAGDGSQRSRLESLAQELRVGARFLGGISSDEVRRLLPGASVFCAPSMRARNGDDEGLGMVFLEAQASAVPVVSFRSGGVSEAVIEGETGLLAAPGDVPALAEAILRLLGDAPLRRRMGQAGRAHVQAQFDLRSQARALESLYDRRVSAGPR